MSDLLDQILAESGRTQEDLERVRAAAHGGGAFAMPAAVPDTPEWRRIRDLPRRPVGSGEELVEELTDVLRTPWGLMRLLPQQALALHDAYCFRGLLAPLPVGAGKTLVSYLLPVLLDAQRPLLILPAGLRAKTEADFRELSHHWYGPRYYRIVTYEALGRKGQAKLLDNYQPDLIVADEVHALKNASASVTKRVKRYVEGVRASGGDLIFAGMSGTIVRKSIQDYAHLARWALPRTCPVPTDFRDLQVWSAALDDDFGGYVRVMPGVLEELAEGIDEPDRLSRVRQGFRRRLTETPGVVTMQGRTVDAGLEMYTIMAEDTCPQIASVVETLRLDWALPDGWEFEDAPTAWRHAREIGLGFWNRWDPRPPDWWLEPRAEWTSLCRQILKHNRRGLDSAEQVQDAIQAGEIDDGGALERWLEVRDEFRPNPVPVWISDEAVRAVERWLRKHRGIVWCANRAMGFELERRLGLPYYRDEACDGRGRHIRLHPPGRSMVASTKSCGTGQNLQPWSNNLVLGPPTGGLEWEQMIGRTHRQGQTADTVRVWTYVGSIEDLEAIHRARRLAKMTQDTTGQEQKLVYATWVDLPDVEDIADRPGYRWRKRP